jgi:hypothetical protein
MEQGMNAEAQRIAIAEACNDARPYYSNGVRHIDSFNYTESLGAMHFAEQSIRRDHDKWGMYLQYLNRTAPECRVHATAAQKAEAFLRAIGKWEGGK